LSASADANVYLCDIGTGHRLAKMRGHGGAVRAVACSADGRSAVSASWDHTIRVWDTDTGAERARFGTSLDYFTSVALSPDGKLVLAGGGGNNHVHVYDAESGQKLRSFDWHTNWVMSVACSPDGRLALSSSYDGTVRLWEIATGKELHCFTGHTNWVMSVAFFPDGRQAVSADADGTIRIWRLGALADLGRQDLQKSLARH
jgi:WD40 repeat protein